MRSFKYKIWDIPNKCWVGAPYALTQFGDLLCNGMVFENMGDFEVCEYSGFQDKNNTKIFEGDIVKCVNHGKLNPFVVNSEDFTSTVSFEFGAFVIKNNNNYDLLANWSHLCEVVGNIHDKPV